LYVDTDIGLVYNKGRHVGGLSGLEDEVPHGTVSHRGGATRWGGGLGRSHDWLVQHLLQLGFGLDVHFFLWPGNRYRGNTGLGCFTK
jgi:hypothetical protein